MKKYMAIILICALALGMLSGCSTNAESMSTVQTFDAEQTEGTRDAVPTEMSIAEPVDKSSLVADVSASETSIGRNITLPIVEEPITYTYWLCYAPFAADLVNTDTMEGILVLDTIQEQSNIHFDITAANGGADRDNFSLMIASGNYADIIFDMSYYSTGLEGAVEDGIIQDLAEVLPEQCPTYWGYLSQNPETLMQAYTDSGYMPTICALVPEVGQEVVGPVLRKDWLDEFGMVLWLPSTKWAFRT